MIQYVEMQEELSILHKFEVPPMRNLIICSHARYEATKAAACELVSLSKYDVLPSAWLQDNDMTIVDCEGFITHYKVVEDIYYDA